MEIKFVTPAGSQATVAFYSSVRTREEADRLVEFLSMAKGWMIIDQYAERAAEYVKTQWDGMSA